MQDAYSESQVQLVAEGRKVAVSRKKMLNQIHQSKKLLFQEETAIMPSWATYDSILLLKELVHSTSTAIILQNVSKTGLIHQLLKLTNWLQMLLIQSKLINQVLIPNLNNENCTVFLEESRKRLKATNPLKHWNLLMNSCMGYIGKHIFALRSEHPTKLQKIHQRLMNEVLDRAIRLQSENGQNSQAMLQVILHCLKVSSVNALTWHLRSSIKNMKINKKTHAKLQWKLHNLPALQQKKTRKFKFMDYEWYLQAYRINGNLQVILDYLPSLSFFPRLLVFYTKTVWVVSGEEDSHQEEITLHFINMAVPEAVKVFNISHDMERHVGNRKIGLSLYCSLEHIYSFTMNCIAENYDKIKIDLMTMDSQELQALAYICKARQMYSQALLFTKTLTKIVKCINPAILQGYPTDSLSSYENEFLAALRNGSYQNEKDNLQHNRKSSFKKSQGSRCSSAGRTRKIFNNSSCHNPNERNNKIEEMLAITDLRRYVNQNHPRASSICAFLSE